MKPVALGRCISRRDQSRAHSCSLILAPSRSTAAPIASIAAPFVTGMNVTAFFGNLFMLQDVLTPTPGSDGPL